MVTRFLTRGRVVALLVAAMLVVPPSATAQDGALPSALQERYSARELDNLLGRVALYPDALLAQVLVASTFPEQVEDAARFVRQYGTDGIDDQPWDVSVKAVAHYLSALNLMAEQIDWTTALGRAYAGQSSEVMESVQRLRAEADAHGNLVSNEQQQIVRDDERQYVIVPTQPQVIYVPTYDPFLAFSRPLFTTGFRTPFWSFGVGYPIGSWLIYDFHWGRRTLFYHGWHPSYFHYAGGWRARSFPFVRITNVYVNPRFRNVYVNDGIWRRPINYGNVNRYARVHRDTPVGGRSRSGWDNTDSWRDQQPPSRVAGSVERLERARDARTDASAITRAGEVSRATERSAVSRSPRFEPLRTPAREQGASTPRAPSVPREIVRPGAAERAREVSGGRSPAPSRNAAPERAPSPPRAVTRERTPSPTRSAAPTRAPSPPQQVAPPRASSAPRQASPAPPPRAPSASPARGERVERARTGRPQ
jgi:hypothetical protein